MQKFTRSLTREIEVVGERLAVTFSQEGLEIRPVGSRRPPHTMTWGAVVHACANRAGQHGPSDSDVGEALKAIRAGGTREQKSTVAQGQTASAAEGHEAHGAEQPAGEGVQEQEVSGHSGRQGAGSAPPAGNLAQALNRLDDWLKKHRARYSKALLPPATAEQLKALQDVLGQALPPELHAWLAWHNGQNPDVPGALEENWRPMSTTDIAQAKRELDAEGHPGWDRSWIPFLDDDNDDYLCLDPGQPGCPVRECWRGKAEHGVVAPSLAAWVGQFLSGLEQGKYVEDPERGGFHRRGG
jgi:cell wall assembly regulator SMI1